MKKILIMILAAILATGAAYGATSAEDAESRDLDQLHNKIVRLKKEMDRLMKDIVTTSYDQTNAILPEFGQDVKVDIVEGDKDITVKADLPGMEKDKIDVTLEKARFLRIAGTREILKNQTAPGVVKQERSLGRVDRVIELPAECLNEGINASYKDGVLTLVIPKKKLSKEEAVKIKVI